MLPEHNFTFIVDISTIIEYILNTLSMILTVNDNIVYLVLILLSIILNSLFMILTINNILYLVLMLPNHYLKSFPRF